MRRGEVWWANLSPPGGSEPAYRRPVLIVQIDPINESRIQTLVVLAFTSNLRLANAPGNVLCRRRDTGLSKDSVANVPQLATLDKSWLERRVSTLPRHLLSQVENGLRLFLGL